ncbi:hypothetical protein GCWU000324_01393 [Kingella oralis ATCC 51147]|uniref:Uncharacterized protein n=1 Tax=Kingella oralis ATCC 51147 TaxID=629741 RepID=C4GGX5_9NEIS|nr:hypothetical protein GCWU000324_01393 [Kingella oralis ATCC 51147]
MSITIRWGVGMVLFLDGWAGAVSGCLGRFYFVSNRQPEN